jgi:N4-gp56 family major capsid protein
MADSNSTTTSNGNLMQSWFSQKMLVRLEPQVKLAEFAQRDEIPLRTGTTATWNGWRTLGAASSTLAEGVNNSLVALSSRRVTATIAGYGRGHKLTDLLQMTAIFDAVNGAMDVLSDSAAKTVERICQTGIYKSLYANNLSTTGILSALMSSLASALCGVTGTNTNSNSLFQFPAIFGTSAARLSAVNKATGGSLSSQVSVNSLRRVLQKLRLQNARPMADGLFVGYTHPNALHALRRDPTWVNWNQYQNSKETMYRGETGMIEGIRFVTSTEAPRYAVAAHSVNMVFVFGQQAYGLTTLNGQVEMLISRGPDKADAFNLFTQVAYKVYAAAACLNPSAGRILFVHEIIA